MRLAVVLVVVSLFVGASFAALEVPPLTGRIVDLARLLPDDQARSLAEELAAHERRTGNQIVVLTVPSLDGEPLEEFSHKVASIWRLGKKGTDNGVLLLVVPNDRRARIEVGYGLEGVLTDAKASRIIRDEMVPSFRAQDYPRGIVAGARAIMGTIEGTYTEAAPQPVRPALEGRWGTLPMAVLVGAIVGALLGMSRMAVGVAGGGVLSFLIALSSGLLLALLAAGIAIIGALVLGAVFRASGSTRSGGFGGWSGGFGGSGGSFGGIDSFSGGGGGFGGGGASGRW